MVEAGSGSLHVSHEIYRSGNLTSLQFFHGQRDNEQDKNQGRETYFGTATAVTAPSNPKSVICLASMFEMTEFE